MKATTGVTMFAGEDVSTATAVSPEDAKAFCNSRSAASGRSKTNSFSLMLAPISGAREIHSLTGAASKVTARPANTTKRSEMKLALTQGGIPMLRARLIAGASVMPTTNATVTGNKTGRQK
jgi:hypothetical protein